MSPMPVERWGHFCGLVSTEQGPEVVVSGGYSYPDFVDSVHIYNVDTDTWREGNKTKAIWFQSCSSCFDDFQPTLFPKQLAMPLQCNMMVPFSLLVATVEMATTWQKSTNTMLQRMPGSSNLLSWRLQGTSMFLFWFRNPCFRNALELS